MPSSRRRRPRNHAGLCAVQQTATDVTVGSRDTQGMMAGTASTSAAAPITKRTRTVRDEIDEEAYAEGVAGLKKECMREGRVLSRSELLDIVAVKLFLRHDAWLASKKKARMSFRGFCRARCRCSAAQDERVPGCLEGVCGACDQRGPPTTAPSGGPRGVKTPRFSRTTTRALALRNWLHERELV